MSLRLAPADTFLREFTIPHPLICLALNIVIATEVVIQAWIASRELQTMFCCPLVSTSIQHTSLLVRRSMHPILMEWNLVCFQEHRIAGSLRYPVVCPFIGVEYSLVESV